MVSFKSGVAYAPDVSRRSTPERLLRSARWASRILRALTAERSVTFSVEFAQAYERFQLETDRTKTAA